MSRIGRKPVALPGGVKASQEGTKLLVQGPKGKLEMTVSPRMKVGITDTQVTVERPTNVRVDRMLHGLTRSLIQNMVIGVTEGYKKELELEGVGFKAQMKGKALNLLVGFTHPVDIEAPAGVEIKCPSQTRIDVTGIDKQKVGQTAAVIRSVSRPEPYKGKGIHYVGEHIRRKQGKTVG